jgi:hypothetical protein
VLAAVAVMQVVIAWQRPALSAAARRYVLARAEENPMGFKHEWFAERAERFLDGYRVTNPQFWVPALCGLGVALAWRTRQRRWFGPLLLAASVADVWTLGRPLVPQSDLARYPLVVSHPVLAAAERETELCRVYRWGPKMAFLMRPNLLLVDGLQDLAGAFSLSPPTVQSLPSVDNDDAPDRLLDAQNVKYALRLDSQAPLPAERFELLMESGGVRLYRNRGCLPRAWWVPRAEAAPDRGELLRRMKAADFDPRSVVLLEEPPPAGATASAGSGEVTVTRYTPLRVAVRVRSDADGWLVLADSWDSGWQARVDGQPVKLYRADWVLRGVLVPRGEHEVEFEFSPRVFWVGLAVSAAALLAVVAGGLWRLFSVGAGRGC